MPESILIRQLFDRARQGDGRGCETHPASVPRASCPSCVFYAVVIVVRQPLVALITAM